MAKIAGILVLILLLVPNLAEAQSFSNFRRLFIQEEGSTLNARSLLNFIGTSVECVDNSSTGATDCTFTGTGGGGSGGTWSTTTSQVSGQLINYPNNTDDIVVIGSNATTTAEFYYDPNTKDFLVQTASSTIVGPLRVTGALTATLTGNADTATALANNGGNCSAGSFPLGVDTAGAVETCTDAWTEAENTSAAYAAQATTLTVAGTASQITSSAGAQSLAANRTWTLSLPNHVIFPSSFQVAEATTTHATTTSFYISELTASRAIFTDANKRLTTTGTVGGIEAAVGSQNLLLETEIDACSELAALLDEETGTCNGTSGPVFPTNPTFVGMIATGAIDFGGGVLEISNGTAPVADDVGELAHDTTDNMLILDDFVVGRATTRIWSVTVASTSPAFIAGSLLSIPVELDGYTMTAIRCKVDSGTSKVIAVEDASANSTEDITCATTVTSDDGTITNAAATAAEEMYIDFGATSGAVDTVSITVFGQWTRE